MRIGFKVYKKIDVYARVGRRSKYLHSTNAFRTCREACWNAWEKYPMYLRREIFARFDKTRR